MHLFAGAGGGLLADLILGHTPVVAVEWEPYPCQILRERRDEGWFPDLRVWEGDVRLFDPSEYTGRVDCIHAGFPCQDISQAGKQAGVGKGTRSGLYREVLRIAGTVRPRFIFLENVAAIKSNGLEQVVKDLALMGYDTRWLCVRASDVGAPHHRDRWFLLANAKSGGDRRNSGELSQSDEQETPQRQEERVRQPIDASEGGIPANVPNTDNSGRRNGALQYIGGQLECASNAGNDGQEGAMAPCGGCGYVFDHELLGRYGCPNCEGEDIPDCHSDNVQGLEQEPQPCEHGRSTGLHHREGSQPAADWWQVEPAVGRVVNGMAHRTHRLKALGNGQVPLQVAVAFTLLAEGLIDAYS